ncbi:hypothetical protein [Marinobacter arenosus]|uniref:hypothetical protein n=1 Tax=Marinobacter arenosus TaxID=2856822 RepID=UPI001C4CC414|nr:hypothetical protein [Marinobacter arenosus]MBW0146219.1 hypothetical protein [Marinobacter arenosus]
MTEGPVLPASRKRLLLAVYLDFVVYSVVWVPIELIIRQYAEPAFWLEYVVFAVWLIVTHRLGYSAGLSLLSIDRDGYVDPDVKRRESWLTMLIGVMFLLEGSKQMVRWTQFVTPEPLFGWIPPEGVQVPFKITLGLLYAWVGVLFLKVHRAGYVLGVATCGLLLLSHLMSWSLWEQMGSDVFAARQEFRGQDVSDDQLALVQAFIPHLLLVGIVLLGVLVASTYGRFRSVEHQ